MYLLRNADVDLSHRDWREKQAAEIKKRDEASKAKRDETIGKAERAIDQFYEEYAAKKEKAIRENKYVIDPVCVFAECSSCF